MARADWTDPRDRRWIWAERLAGFAAEAMETAGAAERQEVGAQRAA